MLIMHWHSYRAIAQPMLTVANVHRDIAYTDEDVKDLVKLLLALTGPCVKNRACMAPWIANEVDSNPHGLRLNAIDHKGNFL